MGTWLLKNSHKKAHKSFTAEHAKTAEIFPYKFIAAKKVQNIFGHRVHRAHREFLSYEQRESRNEHRFSFDKQDGNWL